jgi:hypothetical protein
VIKYNTFITQLINKGIFLVSEPKKSTSKRPTTENTNPVGRPTNYSPEICERAELLLREGLSIEELGLELNTGYTTLYTWMNTHPDFRQAIERGREFSKGWWIKKGRTGLHDKTLNSQLYQLNMRNRFDWDKKDDPSADQDQKSLMQKLIDKL